MSPFSILLLIIVGMYFLALHEEKHKDGPEYYRGVKLDDKE